MPNPYEAASRRKKAERLAHRLFEAKITAEQAQEYFAQEQWSKLARIVGVNAPSPETCQVTLEILKSKEEELYGNSKSASATGSR